MVMRLTLEYEYNHHRTVCCMFIELRSAEYNVMVLTVARVEGSRAAERARCQWHYGFYDASSYMIRCERKCFRLTSP
jgi:hypothetical protein